MRKISLLLVGVMCMIQLSATIHVIKVWNGYQQFMPRDLGEIYLGDTIQWLPLDFPAMTHTVTSTNIPNGALAFDQIWKAPRDTFFQYVPAVIGVYDYECTPHASTMIGSFTVVSRPTEIQESENVYNPVVLFPNPAEDVVYTNKALNYVIYGLEGKIYLSGNNASSIPISTLPTGVYLVEIIGDKPQVIKLRKE
jgi:plastocyanin